MHVSNSLVQIGILIPKGNTSSFKSFNPEAEDSISKSHLVTAEAFVAKIGLTNSTHKSLACTINLGVNLIFIPK